MSRNSSQRSPADWTDVDVDLRPYAKLQVRDVGACDQRTSPTTARIVSSGWAYRFRNPDGPPAAGGVVADAVYRSLRDPAMPTMYVPLAQWNFPFPMAGISLGVRSASAPPLQLARGIADALTKIDPDLAFNFRSFEEQVNASLTQERIVALMSAVFGASRCCSRAWVSMA